MLLIIGYVVVMEQMTVQAMDVVDCSDDTSSTTSVIRPSTDETPSTSPEVTSISHLTDTAHRRRATTSAQSVPDVRLTSRQHVEEDGGHRQQRAVDEDSCVPRQTSTEPSDPSRRRRHLSDRPIYRGTGVTSAEEDDVFNAEDLNVVDEGIEDCLVTSLRAEVS